jgi:hypothetical protein
MEPGAALLIQDILRDERARIDAFGDDLRRESGDRPLALKTGTSSGFRDAWAVGYLVTAEAVDLNQPRDSGLLLDRGNRIGCRGSGGAQRPTLAQALRYGLNDRTVRNFGAVRRQGTEVLTPLRRDAARLDQVLLIEPLDVGRVGSLQVRRIVLMLEYCAHELGAWGSSANDYAAARPEGARSVAKQPLSSNALKSQKCA